MKKPNKWKRLYNWLQSEQILSERAKAELNRFIDHFDCDCNGKTVGTYGNKSAIEVVAVLKKFGIKYKCVNNIIESDDIDLMAGRATYYFDKMHSDLIEANYEYIKAFGCKKIECENFEFMATYDDSVIDNVRIEDCRFQTPSAGMIEFNPYDYE